jgi:MFS family permease
MFTPGLQQIADDLNATKTAVIATQTGYIITLGFGPLILAPLSETFGRRKLYLTCFGFFALLQIPTALSPNVGFMIAVRSIAGLFGSIGIANGGGTMSDMFLPSERAGMMGYYTLGALLGPTIGKYIRNQIWHMRTNSFRPIVWGPDRNQTWVAMDLFRFVHSLHVHYYSLFLYSQRKLCPCHSG